MTSITLHEGDNREHLRRLIEQGVQVHSVVTDPPYGLVSVTKRFGGEKAAPAKFGSDGAFSRASAGFMGSKWDGTGIERDPEFWALIYEILLPGGYVLAFSSPRTGHWQACAMEIAGFVMHPFFGWVYGQGFPKGHDPKLEGWEGWKYGGQATKPALEPIYVGQKPFSEKNGALNILKHGVGAINIDECRVPIDPEVDASQLRTMQRGERGNEDGWGMGATANATVVSPQGRYPANLLHDGSDDVVALFPESGGQRGALKGHAKDRQSPNGAFGKFGPAHDCEPRNDSGSAARFFNCFPPDADPIHYHGKATKADRAGSKHPTVKPVALMRWLCRLVTPPGGVVLDPFGGSGTTAEAARQEGFDCVLMEAEPQFAADIRTRFNLTTDFDFHDLLGTEIDTFDSLLG